MGRCGDIRTRAVAEGDDELGARYRLFGNKMWISGGDQDVSENIVHLVLAKIAQDDGSLVEGSRGISLFIVPKVLPDGRANDVVVAGLNHKLGYRGTANCLLNFGENDGAIGWRIGEAGQGLPQMFMMMNEARIGVGMGAASLAYRGYRQSLGYAQDRTQGRASGSKGGSPVAIIEHADVRHMLLRQKCYAEGALALCLYCARLVENEANEADASLLALLTPVAKSWPSEFGVIANDLAIQVHGGYGYTRDFDVEQLWRDNRLNPIHEGTTGIQAVDLLGRKILYSDGRSMALLRERVARTAEQAKKFEALAGFTPALLDLWSAIDATVEGLRGQGSYAFDDATMFLRAFGHAVVAWLWLDQSLVAAGRPETPVGLGVIYNCRYFFENEIPQANSWLSIVASQNDTARTVPAEVFA
jgi:alkylation response protein AidB-like acyl-CoA dehydrogenase